MTVAGAAVHVDEAVGERGGAPAPRERLLALDLLRGMTVAAMLLVNDPGSWGNIHAPFEHARWHGWTPTDLIFPFFLFIVGITTQLSIAARVARGDTGGATDDGSIVRQVLRRAGLIVLIGVLLNFFPFFTWGVVAGNPDPSFSARVVDRLLHLRLPGVLQRIGLCYGAVALLVLRTSLRTQLLALVALLFGYWWAMTLLPVPGTGMLGALTLGSAPGTLAAWSDRALLDWGRFGNHLWAGTVTWDPEGPLSTIPAIGSALLGAWAGRWIGTRRPLNERLAALFAVGAIVAMLGAMWGWSFPVNKNLWTSSYVLLTAGLAAIALATCMWLVDVQGARGPWTRIFLPFGVNPILAFVGAGAMARLIYSVITVTGDDGRRIPIQTVVYKALYASWLAPADASLLFALTFVLFWFAVLSVLYRRGIIFKV